MIQNAMELLARASSTSEVLILNLTNLLILLVLKALIFGFGLFSVGGTGRSADTPMVTQADLTGGMCFLMFTSGAEEKLDCIQRTAFSLLVAPADQLTHPWSPKQTSQEACASLCSPQEPRKSWIVSSVPPARTPTLPLTT